MVDLPSGSFIQEDMARCSYLCEAGKDCCDRMASCKCGTHTGQFECICEKGYYGKGLQHECTGESLVCAHLYPSAVAVQQKSLELYDFKSVYDCSWVNQITPLVSTIPTCIVWWLGSHVGSLGCFAVGWMWTCLKWCLMKEESLVDMRLLMICQASLCLLREWWWQGTDQELAKPRNLEDKIWTVFICSYPDF